jgi:hypothetical protein
LTFRALRTFLTLRAAFLRAGFRFFAAFLATFRLTAFRCFAGFFLAAFLRGVGLAGAPAGGVGGGGGGGAGVHAGGDHSFSGVGLVPGMSQPPPLVSSVNMGSSVCVLLDFRGLIHCVWPAAPQGRFA